MMKLFCSKCQKVFEAEKPSGSSSVKCPLCGGEQEYPQTVPGPGVVVGDFLIEKVVETMTDYGFDGWHAADDIAAAKKYSVFGPDEAVRWQICEYGEITCEELRDWAFSAPVGSIGGPFDVPDGLVIAKIVERTEGTLEESAVSEQVANVTLARIGFYMVVAEPEPRTREHVYEALMKWKAQNVQKLFFKSLHEGMKIEYPQGTNCVYNAQI